MPTPPNTKLRPRKYYRRETCTNMCSMSVRALGEGRAALVHSWFELGYNNEKIVALSIENGFKLSEGAVGRHRGKHLGVVEDAAKEQPDEKLVKVNHIELLEQIIARGARNMALPGVRISPEMALKAMDMHYRLTQGSAMDNFLSAVTAVMSGEEDDSEYLTALEAAEARATKEEQVQSEVVGE